MRHSKKAADESDQDDVDDEIYECVHGDLGGLHIVFGSSVSVHSPKI